MERRTPWVAFKLDFEIVNKLFDMINQNNKTKKALFESLKSEGSVINTPKIESFLYWSEYLNLIEKISREKYKVTDFGLYLQRLKEKEPMAVLEMEYYCLCKANLIVSHLVNVVGYEFNLKIPPEFSAEDAKLALIKIKEELNTTEEQIRKKALLYLHSLTQPSGFGKLGLFEEMGNGGYRVKPHLPHWKTVAYILSDYLREAKIPRIPIDDLFLKRNNLAKIFFLDKSRIGELLVILNQKEIVSVESSAGLKQIALSSKLQNLNELFNEVILK